jgi:hypothetical protein
VDAVLGIAGATRRPGPQPVDRAERAVVVEAVAADVVKADVVGATGCA